jgi:hypothetical protein
MVRGQAPRVQCLGRKDKRSGLLNYQKATIWFWCYDSVSRLARICMHTAMFETIWTTMPSCWHKLWISVRSTKTATEVFIILRICQWCRLKRHKPWWCALVTLNRMHREMELTACRRICATNKPMRSECLLEALVFQGTHCNISEMTNVSMT